MALQSHLKRYLLCVEERVLFSSTLLSLGLKHASTPAASLGAIDSFLHVELLDLSIYRLPHLLQILEARM